MHALGGFFHQRQPDAGACKVFLAVQALEHFKNAIVVFHVKAHTVVAHPQASHPVTRPAAQLQARRCGGGRELDGVAQQIAQGQGQAGGIGQHHGTVKIGAYRAVVGLDRGLRKRQRILHLARQRQRAQLQVAALHARVGQQIVNQLLHALYASAYLGQKPAPIVIEFVLVIERQQVAVALHTA